MQQKDMALTIQKFFPGKMLFRSANAATIAPAMNKTLRDRKKIVSTINSGR